MNDNVTLYDGFIAKMAPGYNAVEIDPEKALKAIGQQYGLYYPEQNELYMRVVVAGIPEMPALELQKELSHDGSNHWDMIKMLTTDHKEIEMFQHFQEILKYINEKRRTR